MVTFEQFKQQRLKKSLKENVMGNQQPMPVGDDFTAEKYFGNMRFSPKLRKKLTDKQVRSKTGMI